MIYLIHNTNNNTLKIGKSNNPEKRLKQLLTATSDELKLLKIIKGEDDNIFKTIYSDFHIVREWYKYSEHIVNTFENNEFKEIKVFKERNLITINSLFFEKSEVEKAESIINKLAVEHFNLDVKISLEDVTYGLNYRKSFYLF